MPRYVTFIILALASYAVGNVNNAVIISKLKKSDVRKMGSGNPGTLNMSRNFGLKLGLLTFFLDVLKGALPTLAGFLIFRGVEFKGFYVSDLAMCICGFCAVMGHIYPAVMKFKGGKGIASTIGVFIIMNFAALDKCLGAYACGAWAIISIMSLIAAVFFIYITEFGAMGSFIAITPQAIAVAVRFYLTYGGGKGYLVYYIASNMLILLICFFTWFAHRKNIERMLAGEEHPTSIKEMVIKAKMKKAAAKAAAMAAMEQEAESKAEENK